MKIDEFDKLAQVNELSPGDAVRSAGTGIKNFAKGVAQGFSGKTTSQLDNIKKEITKLTPAERKDLIAHITALNKAPTAAPTQAAAPTTQAPASTGSGITNALKKGASAVGNAIKKGAAAITRPAQQPASTTQPPAAAPTKNAAAGDTYEKAKGLVRTAQSGTKPIPPKAAADIDSAIAKLAKGDKESGVFAAQKIMNLAQAGVDISKQQQAWVANSKAGERFLTQSVYFELTKMLREHNLSWSDLGIRVHLLEGTNKLFGISLI
jgi:hypothetical protein